jgi:hypothetical protein
MRSRTARQFRLAALRWRAGWGELLRRRDIRGYRDLPLGQRLLLDHRAAYSAVRSAGFWRVTFLLAVLATLWRIASWEFDLDGAGRDALGALAALPALPWAARARRRHIRALLARHRP